MDQEPEAHCWKLVPPIQLNWPSVVQGPVWAPAEPAAGAGAAGAEGAAADGAGAAGATEGATGVTLMLGTAVPKMVTAEGAAEATGAGAGAGVGIVGGGIAPPAVAAGAEGAGAAGATALLQWTGGAVFLPGTAPAYWTY